MLEKNLVDFLRELIWKPFESLRKTAPLSEQVLNFSAELPKRGILSFYLCIDIQLFVIFEMEFFGIK
ncbi:hypothetical protein AV926_14845 [Myroides marinus]|uniref:Uncharacterized protein n=1 Tax=Myroides marinus TaxID=703342 RepID=A0A165QY16_9FLAO|nr:hypothetical protein AV926_14845 [Myroides marinus]